MLSQHSPLATRHSLLPTMTLLFAMTLLIATSSLAQVAPVSLAPPSSDPWKLSFGNKPRPQNARTIINAEDGAWFDDVSNTIEFNGKVIVRDPQFTLTCDRLNVVLNKNRQGLKLVTATGNVVINQENTNAQGEKSKSTGKAGIAVYDPSTGDITLKSWPQVQQGVNYQVATEEGTIMILNNKGTFHTIGQTRTMIIEPGEKEKK